MCFEVDTLLQLSPCEPVPRLLQQQYAARPEHPGGFHKGFLPLRDMVDHAEYELRFPFPTPLVEFQKEIQGLPHVLGHILELALHHPNHCIHVGILTIKLHLHLSE